MALIKKNAISMLGAATFITFLIGMTFLLQLNHIVLAEINSLGVFALNIPGMEWRLVAQSIFYGITGILSVIFPVLLVIKTKRFTPLFVGLVLSILSGLIWFSFAIVPFDYSDMSDLSALRIPFFLAMNSAALFFLSIDLGVIVARKWVRTIVMIIAITMAVVGILNLVIFNDLTWIRTNAMVLLYFFALGLIGISVRLWPGRSIL